MTPQRAILIERLTLVVGFLVMVAAIAAFDWRIGLFFAGLGLSGSALDIRWRRP